LLYRKAMSDHLVLMQTYGDLLQADDAQAELYAAGIYSLLVSDGEPGPGSPFQFTVALAVHRRDEEIAARLLARDPTEP
jgi:hypothetical protein